MKISTRNSPYFIEPNEKPIKALKFAFKNNKEELLKITKLNEKIVDSYLSGKDWMPIEVIESACKLNSLNVSIPIMYQNLWFCLDGVKLKRRTATRIIKPTVHFHSVYVEPKDRIIKAIELALDKIGTKCELGKLCNVKRQTVYQWITKKTRPQLLGMLKICQILNIDIWRLIDGCKLYGHSCPEEESIVFRNFPRKDLTDLLVWFKLEGHLAISQAHVETNQKTSGKEVLEKIKNKFINLFRINPKVFWIYDNSTKNGTKKDWTGFKLCIASAPLKQILCLKYGIPLGYKCSFVDIKEEIKACKSKEDLIKIFATCMETEGSFSFKTAGEVKKPYFGFTSISKKLRNQVYSLAEMLDYNPYKVKGYYKNKFMKKMAFEFRIASLNSTLKCVFDILPYLTHSGKIYDIIKILSNKEYLHLIKLQSKPELIHLIKIAREKLDPTNNTCNKKFAEFLQTHNQTSFLYKRSNINNWVSLGDSIHLFGIIKACDLVEKDYFEFIPSYLSFPLWLYGFLTRERLEKIRRQNFIHVEALREINGL